MLLGCGASEMEPSGGTSESGSGDTGGETAAGAGGSTVGESEHAYVTLMDSDFERVVVQSEKPVMVDMWAEWCGPCRAIAPTIEALAVEYQGRAVVAKMNVDDNQVIPSQFEIEAIPTLLFFKDGKLVERMKGGGSKAQIAAQLDAMLSGS